MNETLRAAIDAGLATLTRVMDAPTGALGYGTDISCTDDLTEPMRDVDPMNTEAIAQALLRRLDCPRGRLVDDADYGLDVRGYLNKGTTTAQLNALAGAVRNELEKDDRVASITVQATASLDEISLSIRVVPVDVTLGVFSLTFAVTDAAVVLQEISA